MSSNYEARISNMSDSRKDQIHLLNKIVVQDGCKRLPLHRRLIRIQMAHHSMRHTAFGLILRASCEIQHFEYLTNVGIVVILSKVPEYFQVVVQSHSRTFRAKKRGKYFNSHGSTKLIHMFSEIRKQTQKSHGTCF